MRLRKLCLRHFRNVGFASLYFARVFPQATIVAIEPETANFRQLCRNVRHLTNVRPLQAALWSERCRLRISNADDINCAFRVERHSAGEVETMTLEELFVLAPQGKIDLLKIDIEGAEKELFARADPRLGGVGCLFIELHERVVAGCEAAFRAAFQGLDYTERVQGDNLVLTRNGSAA